MELNHAYGFGTITSYLHHGRMIWHFLFQKPVGLWYTYHLCSDAKGMFSPVMHDPHMFYWRKNTILSALTLSHQHEENATWRTWSHFQYSAFFDKSLGDKNGVSRASQDFFIWPMTDLLVLWVFLCSFPLCKRSRFIDSVPLPGYCSC